jgi:hypothetical protein
MAYGRINVCRMRAWSVNLRHSIASLGLAGALACGLAATASVIASDSMSNALLGSTLHLPYQRDEVGPQHNDDNSDDINAIALTGLAVEVEVPREIEPPPNQVIGVATA